jgi:hypothetical protein
VSSACHITNHHNNDFLCQKIDKLNTVFPSNEALPSRVDDPKLDQCLFGQSTDNEDNDDIIEEVALDQFNAILVTILPPFFHFSHSRDFTCP